jgi:hypothetical protein
MVPRGRDHGGPRPVRERAVAKEPGRGRRSQPVEFGSTQYPVSGTDAQDAPRQGRGAELPPAIRRRPAGSPRDLPLQSIKRNNNRRGVSESPAFPF